MDRKVDKIFKLVRKPVKFKTMTTKVGQFLKNVKTHKNEKKIVKIKRNRC